MINERECKYYFQRIRIIIGGSRNWQKRIRGFLLYRGKNKGIICFSLHTFSFLKYLFELKRKISVAELDWRRRDIHSSHFLPFCFHTKRRRSSFYFIFIAFLVHFFLPSRNKQASGSGLDMNIEVCKFPSLELVCLYGSQRKS